MAHSPRIVNVTPSPIASFAELEMPPPLLLLLFLTAAGVEEDELEVEEGLVVEAKFEFVDDCVAVEEEVPVLVGGTWKFANR